MMKIFDRINFRGPEYMFPTVLYIPLLVVLHFISDLFHTGAAEISDKTLQATESLSPDLPDAQLKGGNGIGSKYRNMVKSWGKIQDYSAMDNIERDESDDSKEKYESQYTMGDIVLLNKRQQEKVAAAQVADAKMHEQEVLTELERALAEAKLRGRNEVLPVTDTDSAASAQPPTATIEAKGKMGGEDRSVKAPSESEPPSEMVRKVKTASDYFDALTVNARGPKLIKAIIDEDIRAVDGSRVQLRLLDDVEVSKYVVKRGSYLYATISGFSSGRVKGNITSILIEGELVEVSLSLYNTDGMEGLYVPNSQLRETSKDVASGAVSGNLNMSTGSYDNSLSQWGMQAATDAYQKTNNAIGKAIKKSKVKLKYGTFVYLVNGHGKQ